MNGFKFLRLSCRIIQYAYQYVLERHLSINNAWYGMCRAKTSHCVTSHNVDSAFYSSLNSKMSIDYWAE